MNKEKGTLEQDALRRRAEEVLREKRPAPTSRRAGDDAQKLLHELQVHHVELEMQNEDLRNARAEMEAALEKYTDLYDFAPVGYATLDADGVIRDINLTAARLLGRERSQLIGRSFGFFVSAGPRRVFHAFLAQVMASQEKEACELTLGGNGQEPRTIRMEGMAGAAGQECRMAVMDVTERQQRDLEIKRLNTDLERRAYELEVVNEELEAFSYTVSHDLRGPLTVISGYCAIIQDSSCNLSEECRGHLQKIEQGIHWMNDMIETLLNFSSLTRSALQREPIDFSEIVRAVAVNLGEQHPKRRVTFIIAPGLTGHGDPKLLRVVLENLLGNAWKYTGLKEEAVIEFGMTAEAGKKTYFVRDNGPGFDNADAARLFKAFQRLPGGNQCKGFGIGLATVQRIVQLHGGRVWAEGEVGKGATFFFTVG
jgi:PAS domain S-box-containing protein